MAWRPESPGRFQQAGLFVQQHRNIRRIIALPANQQVPERLDITRGALQVETILLVVAHSHQPGLGEIHRSRDAKAAPEMRDLPSHDLSNADSTVVGSRVQPRNERPLDSRASRVSEW